MKRGEGHFAIWSKPSCGVGLLVCLLCFWLFFFFFQTLLSALTPADDFYKSFLQKHGPLGTRWKVLSRYKVNKQPKRQRLRESLGDARNFITKDYGLWYWCTTDREDVQTRRKKAKSRKSSGLWGSKTPANLEKTGNPSLTRVPQPSSGAASQITSAPCLLHRRVEDVFMGRSTITADKRPTQHIRSSDTCYHEKVRFQVALSLTSIWRWAPRQPLSRAQGKA